MTSRPNSNHYLPFEQPLKAIDERIAKLEDLSKQNDMDLSADIARQVQERTRLVKEIFSKLTAWDRIQLARHVHRPQTADYIDLMCDEFVELHGDRLFRDDPAIVAGLGWVETPAGGASLALGPRREPEMPTDPGTSPSCAGPPAAPRPPAGWRWMFLSWVSWSPPHKSVQAREPPISAASRGPPGPSGDRPRSCRASSPRSR